MRTLRKREPPIQRWVSVQGHAQPRNPAAAHLVGQGWKLQFSTSAAGCWASALHWVGGSVFKMPSWASTQRTGRSRKPPPQDTLHGLKSPAIQLRRKWTEHQARGQVPKLAQGHKVEDKKVCLTDPDNTLSLVWSRSYIPKLLLQDQPQAGTSLNMFLILRLGIL